MNRESSNCGGGRTCIPARATRTCPASGTAGTSVELQTVKALLNTAALQRLEPSAYRFCPSAACDVVYFDDQGRTFSTADLRVGVWQKQAASDHTVCYCFGENEADIREEIACDGRSRAVERVRAHIQAGRCACEIRNPRGACCLGDITAVVKRLLGQAAAYDGGGSDAT